MFGSNLLAFASLLLPIIAAPLANVDRSPHVSTALDLRDESRVDVTAPNALKREALIDMVVLDNAKTEEANIKRESWLSTNEEEANPDGEIVEEKEVTDHIEGKQGVLLGQDISGNKRGVRPGKNVGGNKRGVRSGNNIGGGKRGVRPGGNIGAGKRGVRPGKNIGASKRGVRPGGNIGGH